MSGFLRRFAAPRGARQSAAPRVAALVAVLALTAGCSGKALSSPQDSPGTTSAGQTSSGSVTLAPTPEVGTCRRLDYAAISHYSNGDATVSCDSAHTAYTFAVETIPSDVRVSGVSIGNKSIQHAASDGCREAFDTYIGGTPPARALARLSVTYFLPTQTAFNNGAHWVRCDVVALATASSLAPLPMHLDGFLDDPAVLSDYGVCMQGEPSAPRSPLVMCTENHQYRALTTLRLGADSAPYPGEAVAHTQGEQRCADYLKETLGTTTSYAYAWTYPTSTDWDAGQRFGFCWKKTHH